MAALATVGIIAFVVSHNRSQQPSFKFSYLRKHKAKSKKLKDLMEELSVRANDIKRRLDLSEDYYGKEQPNNEIKQWLEDVENIQREGYKLAGEVGERKRCLNGRLPNYRLRLKLGKHMEIKIKEAIVLLGEARFLDDSSTKIHQEKRKRDNSVHPNII